MPSRKQKNSGTFLCHKDIVGIILFNFIENYLNKIMQTYRINDLERLSGVKAHTIRIWEQRYHIITPLRTDTNRRTYSDDHVRKLLNVTTLLSRGHKISKIAAYSESEVNQLIQNVTIAESGVYIAYINDMVKHMLAFEQQGFERAFTKAVGHFGIHKAVVNVIYPFLCKTGILWSVNKTAPVQEHFASCIIRRKMVAMTDNLPSAVRSKKKFLLFLPPGEWHEIGLLFANYIIRSKGHETIYLGQNVPIEDVIKTADAMNPSFIMLFYIAARPTTEIEQHLSDLRKPGKDRQLLVAGNNALFPKRKTAVKDITYLEEVDDLMEFI